MKNAIVGLALLGIIVFNLPRFADEASPGLTEIIVVAVFALPFLAFIWMICRFNRWHRGFHHRMKTEGFR
jgi:hypothetical protein